MSEREPELGLGIVAGVEMDRIRVRFVAVGEERLYAAGSGALRRVIFREGETVSMQGGERLRVESVEEENGLMVYVGEGRRVREDRLSDRATLNLPEERLMSGQADACEVFALRLRALRAQWQYRCSPVRGFLGGRLDLIPHQFYIAHEVTSRPVPRVLLADEVGLGKTIEACLILQRLLAVGKVRRALIIVPESLLHQWFVELLRRFNLWFSIYDEARCAASGRSDAEGNPFLDEQLALCSVSFLTGSELRREESLRAGWDLVVVDEAHHLEWTREGASAEYGMVAQFAQSVPGLLLLTATPTQLGMEGHFARLKLLDPDRYRDFPDFLEESTGYGVVAAIAGKIIGDRALTTDDETALKRIFRRDRKGLAERLEALSKNRPGARGALLRSLLDEHGTGRVMFRNTRSAMSGFPLRKLCAAPVAVEEPARVVRTFRELEAEETGHESGIRYSFREDPRIEWLIELLGKLKPAKVLLICKSERKVLAIENALREKTSAKVALFHEGLPLVARDRNAAWFAEEDGARLLLCSEIGSEGRNFQFAHHLVLFDLPLNPGLLEQRIGRLDRIGQTETIRIHVPFLQGSVEARVLDWYDRGVDAFGGPVHGGDAFLQAFREPLLALIADGVRGDDARWNALIGKTAAFRRKLLKKMKEGRDRLLELNSFDPASAATVIERIREADADPRWQTLLSDLFEHFGVRVREHEEGDVFLDANHAVVEAFPGIPRDGVLATFRRDRAIVREDISFVSPDHTLYRDTIDLLINSPAGTAAFGQREGDEPNVVLEAVFVLEAVADTRWHVEQFLAPTPLHLVIDVRGRDLSHTDEWSGRAREIRDAPVRLLSERLGSAGDLLKSLLEGAGEEAERRAEKIREEAVRVASDALGADLRRLLDLRKINDHVRGEEIELARQRLEISIAAIREARLRLDSIRLVLVAPE